MVAAAYDNIVVFCEGDLPWRPALCNARREVAQVLSLFEFVHIESVNSVIYNDDTSTSAKGRIPAFSR